MRKDFKYTVSLIDSFMQGASQLTEYTESRKEYADHSYIIKETSIIERISSMIAIRNVKKKNYVV